MQSIAVLIPCYNEAKTIKKVVEDWKRELPEAKIYVYDNNSTDGTAKIAEDAGAVVRYERLQGNGNVVRRMFQEIEADCYIMADGDDQHPAEEGCGMAELVLNNGVDMVIGDRLSSSYFQENQRRFHNFGNNLVRYLINKIFNANVKDIMTGYRALSYRFVKSFPVVSQGFEIEAEMTIHAVDKNMSFVNKTVPFRNRPEGSVSSMNTIVDGIKVIKTILHLFCDYRPFVFFSLNSRLFKHIIFNIFYSGLKRIFSNRTCTALPDFNYMRLRYDRCDKFIYCRNNFADYQAQRAARI